MDSLLTSLWCTHCLPVYLLIANLFNRLTANLTFMYSPLSIADLSNVLVTDLSNVLVADLSNVHVADLSNVLIADLSNVLIADLSNVLIAVFLGL